MALLEDLTIILGGRARARSIHRSLFAGAGARHKAFDKLVSAAKQGKLGIVRACALLLKYCDEARQVRGEPEARDDVRSSYAGAFMLFETLSSYDPRYPVLTHSDLALLVGELTLLGLRDLPTDSEALAYIEEQYDLVFRQFAEADEAATERYRMLKLDWVDRNIEREALEASLEARIEAADSVRRDFKQIFGNEFAAEREQLSRLRIAERRLQLLKENPGLNEADVERMLGQARRDQASKLSRHQFRLPPGFLLPGTRKNLPDDDRFTRAKTALRSLASLTHPDGMSRLNLSHGQREKLDSIWHETASLRAVDCSKAVLARAVDFLESRLQLARCILDMGHIDALDPSLIVPGSTLDEQIRWLENMNPFIDEQVRCLQADNLQFTRNRQLDDMRRLIAAPEETRQAERQAMIERSRSLARRADAFERRAARLLGART